MKFMIAIIIMFAPPNYPEGDMLIVDKQGEKALRFDTFEDCAVYVHQNIGALHIFAFESYAPKQVGVDHISCLVDPTTKGKAVDNVR